jgi:polysaccharide biosynthesis/export protein
MSWIAPGRRRAAWPLRHILIVVLALHTPSVGLAQQGAAPDYIVGPNDVLAIMVVDEPQLTGKYIVRADGTFTFPLIGRLNAGGLRLQAVEDDVRTRLGKGFLKNPQVGVSVEQYRSQQIFVMGEVRQPGSFQFTGQMRLIEALARAGSTTERARSEAVIVRPRQGANTAAEPAAAVPLTPDATDADVIRIDLDKLQTGAISENVSLHSGDTIFIPKAETFFVSGQVRNPGEFVMRKEMTVRQALALAGDVTERGSTRRIQIMRHVNGVETRVSANPEDPVRPGDNIVVRERLF